MPIHYRIVRTHEAFRDLNDRWNALLSESRSNTVFLTWEWQFSWWETFGHDLYIVLIFEDKTLVAILPFIKIRRVFTDGLRFIGDDDRSDYLDFIIKEGYERKVLAFFFNEFLSEHKNLGMIELGNISETSPSIQCIPEVVSPDLFDIKLKEKRLCPYLALPKFWDVYLAGLSSHRRYYIRRCARRIEETFRVKVGAAGTGAEARMRMAQFMNQHQLRMHQLKRGGAFEKSGPVDFHRKVAERFDKKGYLLLYYLELDETPVASLYLFRYNKVIFFYLSGFTPDRRFFNYSPVSYLLGRCLEDAIAKGMDEFDFLRGEGDYKFRWTRTTRINHRFTIQKRTRPVKVYVFLTRMKNLILQSVAFKIIEKMPFRRQRKLKKLFGYLQRS